MKERDVLVIGGGQAGLAVGYFLRRTGLSFAILDNGRAPGGAWRHAWDSLHLFSPARWSSLPGWPMPESGEEYPSARHVVDYLARYEERYQLPVERPVQVTSLTPVPGGWIVDTPGGLWRARAVVSATGTWGAPFTPRYPGIETFLGQQLHSAHYARPQPLRDLQVLVVGGGNSGAQILAELSLHARTLWAVQEPPRFLPDDVDGRVLFQRATDRWTALQAGRADEIPGGGLASIVAVPPVREARSRGVYDHPRVIAGFSGSSVIWSDASVSAIDAIVWCTGFKPALAHLESLGIVGSNGRVAVTGTRVQQRDRLWLVGMGDWTGFASATLIGVMRGARDTAREISEALSVA